MFRLFQFCRRNEFVLYLTMLFVVTVAWIVWSVPPSFQPIVTIHPEAGESYRGTGFFVSKSIVATAAHVLTKSTEEGYKGMKVGDELEIVSVWHGEKRFKGWILLRSSEYDIGLVKVVNFEAPSVIPIRFEKPKLGETLKILGIVAQKPFVNTAQLCSITTMFWSGNLDGSEETEQEMLLYAPQGLPGLSGSPIVDSEGYAIGIHVGSIRGYGVGTPFWKLQNEINKILKEFCPKEVKK